MLRRRRGLRLVFALASTVAILPGQRASAQGETPRFKTSSEIVTVDVVVTDGKGHSLPGLSRDDFTVSEDGAPQAVASFEAVESKVDVVTDAGVAAVATNVRSAGPGRTFVLVFDDVHLEKDTAKKAKAALAEALAAAFSPGDRVAVVPVSAGGAWSGRMPEGRADLTAVLSRLDGLRVRDISPGRITDYEAMMIYARRDKQVGAEVQRRFYENGQLMEFFPEAGATPPDNLGEGHPLVRAKAAEVYAQNLARDTLTFRTLEHVLQGLTETRGRKAVVLVSDGFIHDPTQPYFKNLLNASRRANAPVYFFDPRDVTGYGAYGDAEQGRSVDYRERSDLTSIHERETREADGSVSIAVDSGGRRLGGDLEAGLKQVVEESRVYYLVGYQPSSAKRDGRFRKIEVKVARPGVEVRARKGYYAPDAAPETPAPAAPKGLDPAVRSVFEAPDDASEVPLRLASYVLRPTTEGKSQVRVVAEADPHVLTFEEKDGRFEAALESYARVVARDTGISQARERIVELRLPSEAKAALERSWLPLEREFELGPGRYQARVAVREKSTGRLGSVTQDFEVPADDFRISTPILTDALRAGHEEGGALSPQMIARRRFDAGTVLHYLFEVYGVSSTGAPPSVRAGYSVRGPDGSTLGRVELAPLAPGPDGRLSKIYNVSLEGAAAGDYAILLDVADAATGRELHSEDRFVVAGDVAPAAALPASGGYLDVVAQYGSGATEAAVTALLLRPRGEIEEAARRIQASAATCDPKCVDAAALLHTAAGVRETSRGRLDLADLQFKAARRILDLRKHEAADRFEARWSVAIGYSFLADADLSLALHYFEQALAKDPASIDALVGVGMVHEALATVGAAPLSAAEVPPVGSPTLPLLQQVAQKERELKTAEERYRKALSVAADHKEARLRLGHVLQLRDKAKEAEAELQHVLAEGRDPDMSCLAHLFLGQLADAGHRAGEGLEHYKAAAEQRPGSQSTGIALSDALRRSGQAAEAHAVVERLFAAPASADPWIAYNLGKPGRADAILAELREGR